VKKNRYADANWTATPPLGSDFPHLAGTAKETNIALADARGEIDLQTLPAAE